MSSDLGFLRGLLSIFLVQQHPSQDQAKLQMWPRYLVLRSHSAPLSGPSRDSGNCLATLPARFWSRDQAAVATMSPYAQVSNIFNQHYKCFPPCCKHSFASHLSCAVFNQNRNSLFFFSHSACSSKVQVIQCSKYAKSSLLKCATYCVIRASRLGAGL